jgi:dethiobiotin synthetase
MPAIVVTATDTGVGKTVFAAALTRALEGFYWKPIQSGSDGETDTAVVGRLAGVSPDRLLAEAYVLGQPLSPHRAAELDGVQIDVDALALPTAAAGRSMVVVEGAGGVLVPLDRKTLQIELFARWRVPVVICSRTALGTINHSLLTIEALRRRRIPILGLAFVGPPMPDSERTICDFGSVKRLGRLPMLTPLDAAGLHAAFAANFTLEDFAAGGR